MPERILSTDAFSDARIAESEVDRLGLLVDERTQLLNRRMPSDPDVRALDRRIDAVQDVIEDRARRFLGSVNAQITVLERRVDALEEARKQIKYCEHFGHEIALDAEVVYPAEHLPDQPPRVAAPSEHEPGAG